MAVRMRPCSSRSEPYRSCFSKVKTALPISPAVVS